MFHPIADRGTPQRLETLSTDMLVRKSDIQNIQHLQPGVLIVSLLPRFPRCPVSCGQVRIPLFLQKLLGLERLKAGL